jgi:hypothetical protein
MVKVKSLQGMRGKGQKMPNLTIEPAARDVPSPPRRWSQVSMEPPSPSSDPWKHSNESDAASWVRLLLERLNIPTSETAGVISTAALTSTGALRDLRKRADDWDEWLDRVGRAIASALGDDTLFEDARQTLLEKLDHALDDVQVKRQRTTEQAAGSSTQFAPGSADSGEILRTKQWCSRQPIIVKQFVRCVLVPRAGSRDPRVVCVCGHECDGSDFCKHLCRGEHKEVFFRQLDQAEALGAKAAVLHVGREVEANGGSWDPVRGCAVGSCPAVPDDDDIECMGESTRAEAEAARDAAAKDAAFDLDAEVDA